MKTNGLAGAVLFGLVCATVAGAAHVLLRGDDVQLTSAEVEAPVTTTVPLGTNLSSVMLDDWCARRENMRRTDMCAHTPAFSD
ncbi:MAG: hypothetical protein AB7G06_06500 [Bdellovibrionales bacterium]